MNAKFTVGVVLFDEFELLDVFGPLEMFGMYPETFEICMVAENVGVVESAQGPECVATTAFNDDFFPDILLVPGGRGTRREVNNALMISWIKSRAASAKYVTSVCTGSAVLARTGLLDGRRATSNKHSLEWVKAQGDKVSWVSRARWVEDGNYLTASGVSAGIDMSLRLISLILDEAAATLAANWAEYEWHRNPEWDPFSEIWGKA